MTNRIPLIVNAGAAQIQELADTDNLIVAGNILAGGFSFANGQPISGGNANAITSGNSSISFDSNGNAIINVNGTDVATVTAEGMEFTGNIIPTSDSVYTLGNATSQWKDLFVSNNTIYLNNIPLNLTPIAGNSNTISIGGVPLIATGANAVLGNVLVTGNLDANISSNGNISTANFSSNTANITGNTTVGGNLSAGNVSTASLTTTGDTTIGGNVSADNANVAGNVTAGFFIGDGSQLTGLPPGYTDANVTTLLASGTVTSNIITSGQVNTDTLASDGATITIDPLNDGSAATGNVVVLGNLQVAGNLTYTDISIATTSNLIWQAANNAGTAAAASGGGLAVGPAGNAYATWTYNSVANAWVSNLPVNVTGNVTTTGNVNAGNLTVSGVTNLGSNISNILIGGGGAGQLVSSDGNGGLTFTNPVTQVPAVYFTAGANGNGQTFSNTVLGGYTSNADMTIFYNGSLLENSNYTLAGDVLTINVPLTTGDSIDVIAQYAANVISASSAYGNSNVSAYLASGNDTANIVTTGNIRGTYVLGNGAFLTGIAAGNYGNSNVTTLLSTGITSNVITTANVSGNYFLGNGALLTGITANYSNANVAAYLPTYSGNIANLTVTGSLNAVTPANSVSNTQVATTEYVQNVVQAAGGYGDAQVEALLSGGTVTSNIITTANVSGTYFLGNGALLTGITANYGNSNVAAYLASNTDPTITGLANTTANNSSNITTLQGNVVTLTSGLANTNSNVANLQSSVANLQNAQYGNSNVSTYLASGTDTAGIVTTGNIQGAYIIGNGSQLTGLPAGYANSNVTTLLSSGTVNTNIITSANVDGNNINATANITATGNVNATGITATGNIVTTGNVSANAVSATTVSAGTFAYANGTPVTFNQDVYITSNISTVVTSSPILVAANYGNAQYPGGVFTIFQPAGAVVTGSLAWASGGTSKNAYSNYAGNVVNTQDIEITLNSVNGNFNVQSSDTITIGTSTITGANLLGLGISGTGGTYTIPAAEFGNNIQIDASTSGNVTLTTTSGSDDATVGTLTTVAPTVFAVANVTAAWANANVIIGESTQTFSWTVSGITGTAVLANVTLAGSSNLVLANTLVYSGNSTAIVSDTGPYEITASYFGTGLNGAGNSYSNVTYSLDPAQDIAPLFYKITSSNANPNFTTSDSHYSIPFFVPQIPQGIAQPGNAQFMTASGVDTDYNWFAIPGGANTWVFGNTVPSSDSSNLPGTNIEAMFDQGAFYQIVLGTPEPANFGEQYFTTLNGQPYTVVGWTGISQAVPLYLANVAS